MDKMCDIDQGFNHVNTAQNTVGFITELEIGKTKFDANIAAWDPKGSKKHQVVAVLNSYSWDKTLTGAMTFHGRINIDNKQHIKVMSDKTWTDTTVKFKFVLFEYDQNPTKKKFFDAALSDKALDGVLEKKGTRFSLGVDEDAATHPQSPINYDFHIGIKPAVAAEQTLTIGYGDAVNAVLPWGVKEGK